MGKIRFQMFIDKDQKKALDKLHRETEISVAEIIRKAICRFLAEYKKTKAIPTDDATVESLISAAGACEGGPEDLADNHDKYLGFTQK